MALDEAAELDEAADEVETGALDVPPWPVEVRTAPPPTVLLLLEEHPTAVNATSIATAATDMFRIEAMAVSVR